MTMDPNIRVGIDGFNLALAQGTGVATYARTLAAALSGLGRRIDLVYGLNVPPSTRRASRETLFFNALAEGRSGGEPPERISPWGHVRRQLLSPRARELVEVDVAGRVLRDGLADRVPAFDRLFTLNRLFHLGGRYLRRYGRLMPVRIADPPAIMHWTYPVPVRMIGTRNVYTIHDLIPLRLPFLSLEDKTYHERLLHECVAASAHILTVSEISRGDILRCLPIAPDHVTNTYQAVPERFADTVAPEVLESRLRALFDLRPQGYFLFYGATEPKKNVGRLIEAYLRADIETPLILAGPQAWHAENELRLLNGAHGTSLRGTRRIRRMEYLPAAHLDTLLRGARGMLFPSLYEGFGLPAVEAMLAGVPVVAGNAGALPEIVGDAGLLVDPYSIDAITAAIVALDRDVGLRERLILRGRERAAEFTMQPYRARLHEAHGRILAARPEPRRAAPRRAYAIAASEPL